MKHQRILSVFSLVMITIGSVSSVRVLPTIAASGSSLIFFCLFAALFFFIPCALVSAELAASAEEEGGIYVWVKNAFGEQFGFFAIWFQWLENVVWTPTVLSFTAGTLLFLISPEAANNKYCLILSIWTIFWLATIVNIFGVKSSANLATFCSIVGLILPMTLIIGFGIVWVMLRNPIQISFTSHELLPDLTNIPVWAALSGMIITFCGIEVATVYAKDTKHPQRSFPRALFYSVIIILSTLVLGSLAVAIMVPPKELSFVSGIMQAMRMFFTQYHLNWALPIIAVLLFIGGVGSISNWIIAPVRGLLIAAQDGILPPNMQRENKYQAPANMLIYQAIILSVLSLAFVYMPTVNAAYWLLGVLSGQVYMFAYILMFAAAIYSRYKFPHRRQLFRISGGGNWGMNIVAGIGIITCLVAFACTFIPPANFIGSTLRYELPVLIAPILSILPPWLIYKFRRPSWK